MDWKNYAIGALLCLAVIGFGLWQLQAAEFQKKQAEQDKNQLAFSAFQQGQQSGVQQAVLSLIQAGQTSLNIVTDSNRMQNITIVAYDSNAFQQQQAFIQQCLQITQKLQSGGS